MARKKCIFTLIFLTIIIIMKMTLVAAADTVTFQGTTKTDAGDPIILKGKLTKPPGDGPFPAVVLVHGCSGIIKYYDKWVDRLASWGYVAFQVDNFGPRGVSEICGKPGVVPFHIRTQDSHDAKAYLGGLPFIDRNRIGIMGWSQGGSTTLLAIIKGNHSLSAGERGAQKQETPFRVAIAFYPYCMVGLDDLNAPLMILVGDLDDWCPAVLCQVKMPKGKAAHEIILKVYPGAYHGFDFEGADWVRLGHRVLYNPEALADSIVQVKEFLAKHLK